MPVELWPQVRSMAECWLILAVLVVPLGALGRLFAAEPLCWQRFRSPWQTWDVPILVLLGFLAPLLCATLLQDATWWKPVDLPDKLLTHLATLLGGAAALPVAQKLQELHVQFLWAKLFAVPLVLGSAWGMLHLTDRRWPTLQPQRWPRSLQVMACLWLLTTPLVLLLNFLCVAVLYNLGQEPEVHPLTRLGAGSTLGQQILFVISVCVFTPILEEFVFRGVLTPWATKSSRNAWLLITAVVALGVLPNLNADPAIGPILFALLAALGLFLLQRFGHWGKIPRRATSGIWASAALFGAIHLNVWPSPVPLFVLGLALGYLALRTGSWGSCAVAHGLFNATSAIYLLRG